VMMNKLLWGLQKHGIYVCVYIYNIHISSIPYQVRFARRWHEKELSSQKKLSLSIYVYLYLYTFYMHIYIIHSQLKKNTNFARNLGTLLDWIVLLDADSRSCSCTTASWFPSRGTSRRRPIRSTVDWSGL
jgi:hypothetical protein